jgi:hypothetical protein
MPRVGEQRGNVRGHRLALARAERVGCQALALLDGLSMPLTRFKKNRSDNHAREEPSSIRLSGHEREALADGGGPFLGLSPF